MISFEKDSQNEEKYKTAQPTAGFILNQVKLNTIRTFTCVNV